jgi:hypothetical protein
MGSGMRNGMVIKNGPLNYDAERNCKVIVKNLLFCFT